MTDFTQKVSGFRFVQTHYGDTLQKLALRELGDASQWATVAWFNNLVPPYLTDDASAVRTGVLLTGATIRVPAATAQVDAAIMPDEVFLADCELQDGQFLFQDGDFQLVSGRANLHQSISNLVSTSHGELLFHGTYGANLRRIIGLTGAVQEMVAAEYVDDALSGENRIQSVTKVVATRQGDSLEISAEVVPITGSSLNVSKVV